jgi:hypothetical protein
VPFIRDYHNRFVTETVERCERTLLLFWDHQLGPQFLTHKALGGKKRVVVLFQGGASDRQALRIAQRFADHEDVVLDLFVVQKAHATMIQDQEALAQFEAQTSKTVAIRGSVTIKRIVEHGFVTRIIEECKTYAPHLIMLGPSEGPETDAASVGHSKRASVLEGADRVFSKTLLLGQLGRAFAESELQSSLLVVMARSNGIARQESQKLALQPLGVIVEDRGAEETKRA